MDYHLAVSASLDKATTTESDLLMSLRMREVLFPVLTGTFYIRTFCLRELTLLLVQGGSSARSTILPIHGRKYQIDEVSYGQEDQVCSSRNQCWPDWSRRPDPKGLPAQLAGTSYRYAVEELELACSADSEVQDHTDSLDIAMV